MCGYDLRDNLDPVYTANGTYSTHLFADKVIDIVNKHQGDKVWPDFFLLVYLRELLCKI